MATILVVEDDEDTLHALRLLLEHAGYQVMLARSGKEALAQVLELAVDLVITDWSEPVRIFVGEAVEQRVIRAPA